MRLRGLIFLGFGIFASCSNNNTTNGVFVQTSKQCLDQELPNEYIATWKNGIIEKLKAHSDEEIIKNFVRPNLENLKTVEHDFKIEIKLPVTTSEVDPSSDSTNWGQNQVRARAAWEAGINGDGVVVAVIDSGVDMNHKYLKNNIFINLNEANGAPGVDDDNNGYIDDVYGWNYVENSPNVVDYLGHGTHVSGIIASEHIDMDLGIAPHAKILPLAFLADGVGRTSDAIMAIRYAAKMGAKIINASWGSNECSQSLFEEVKKLDEQNILIIIAAGNEGNNLSFEPEYPAAYSIAHQITVGASTINNYQAGYSNYGPLVDLVAPGDKIFSTYLQNNFKTLSGTSMATPFVTGVAALLWGAKPSAAAEKIKSAIVNSVVSGPFNVRTRGIIDVQNALKEINIVF